MSTFIISYGNTTIQFGTMTKITQSFSKSVSSTPIVSKSALNTYQVETGSTMTYSISFTRRQVNDPDNESSDMDEWTNEMWYAYVDDLVDRWQARTDGCTLKISGEEGGYVPAVTVNGYIKSLSRKYGTSYNDTITGTIEFTVGTMYVANAATHKDSLTDLIQSTNINDYSILISSSDRSKWYALVNYYKEGDTVYDYRCVDSYEMVGGLGQPFEYVTMEVSKKALATVAPSLVEDNDILAGKNRLRINAVGRCNDLIVTKCKMNSNTYTITAYCGAEVIKGYTIDYNSSGQTVTDSPLNVARNILTSGNYGINFVENTSFIHNVSDKNYRLSFDGTANAWTALQICAMALGAKIFFSGDKAYMIDCTVARNAQTGLTHIEDMDELKLDDTDKSGFMYARVSGDVSLGNEGTDTITNAITVVCASGSSSGTYTSKDTYSISAYGKHDHGDITVCDTTDSSTGITLCTDVGTTYLNYRKVPQQSISFDVKEVSKTSDSSGWQQLFAPITRVKKISDSKDDVTIDAVSLNNVELPQSLMMTGYTRHYPEGTTTYEFGVITNIDLAESTSNILTAQGTK